MSTILDALRKVQRDRDRESPDLHHALAQDESDSARRFSLGPGHWLVVAGLVLLAAGASAYLFVGGDRPGEAIPLQAEGPDEPGVEVAAAPKELSHDPIEDLRQIEKDLVRDAVRERLDGLSRGKPRAGSANAASPQPTDPAADAAAMTPAARKRIAQAIAARGASRAMGPPELESFADELGESPEPVAEASPPARVPEPEPVLVFDPDPDPDPDPEPVHVAALMQPPREPDPEPESTGTDSASLVQSDPWQVSFPDLRLEAVRWHPDSTRREARLLLDSSRSVSAHEGDVIVGVAVHRIDPGAIELRLGNTIRRLRLGE